MLLHTGWGIEPPADFGAVSLNSFRAAKQLPLLHQKRLKTAERLMKNAKTSPQVVRNLQGNRHKPVRTANIA
jgi:hypothetical protein